MLPHFIYGGTEGQKAKLVLAVTGQLLAALEWKPTTCDSQPQAPTEAQGGVVSAGLLFAFSTLYLPLSPPPVPQAW